ncbi:hypothetical protein IQ216_12870, partial [Cyanobium sp. LEGE 06143]|nr:hypothetical protein [Cyanobium sp. LEGE 06143]
APSSSSAGPARAAGEPGPGHSSPLDDKARRLADFFNGDVVELDGPLDDAGQDVA